MSDIPIVGGHPLPWTTRAIGRERSRTDWIEDARGNVVAVNLTEETAKQIVAAVNNFELIEQLRKELDEYRLEDGILRKAYEDSGLAGKFTWSGWLLHIVRENERLSKEVRELKQDASTNRLVIDVQRKALDDICEALKIQFRDGWRTLVDGVTTLVDDCAKQAQEIVDLRDALRDLLKYSPLSGDMAVMIRAIQGGGEEAAQQADSLVDHYRNLDRVQDKARAALPMQESEESHDES